MPSQESIIKRPSLSPLCDIINLRPDAEQWCAGYAPSKGRRCHNPTNAAGRSAAMRILAEATNDLRAGRCINKKLQALAPNVLCLRWHQGQAGDLVGRWERDVKLFLQSYDERALLKRSTPRATRTPIASSTSSPITVTQPQTTNQVQDQEDLRQRCLALEKQLLEAMLQLRQAQSDVSVQTSVAPQQSNVSENAIPATPVRDIEQSESPHTRRLNNNGISNNTTINQVDSAQRQHHAGRQRCPIPSPSVSTDARRKNLTGDCAICYESLCSVHEQAKGHYERDGKYQGDDISDGDSNKQDHPKARTGENDFDEDSLVWCKATCGNNFHKPCLDRWLETISNPTCPFCRCAWKP